MRDFELLPSLTVVRDVILGCFSGLLILYFTSYLWLPKSTVVIVIASRIPPRPYSTEACHSGAACVGEQVMRFMTAVTKIASHQQDGSDAFLGFVMHTRLLSGA